MSRAGDATSKLRRIVQATTFMIYTNLTFDSCS